VTNAQAGQWCALGTAIAWGVAVVLFKRAGDTVPPLVLNLFKNIVGVILLGLTLLGVSLVDAGESWNAARQFPLRDIVILMISGILGIAVADTLFFHALNRCGVGLMSIVDCSYSPCVILCSYLMLGETLTRYHAFGGLLILAAVFIASRHAPPPGRTRGQIAGGIALGVLAMALMAYGIVLAKPILDPDKGNFPLLWATMLRMLAGTAALALTLVSGARRAACRVTFRPSAVWWFSLPAAFFGAYISMVLWVAGFKYAKAGIASILNQTSVIFALLLATLFLHEPLSRRKLLAVFLAIIGVVVIVLGQTPANG